MIPENFHDLLRDETKAFVYLATVMDDGTPQVTPVWFNWDGESILINSARGRVKDRNMRERPDVALVVADPNNPYRYLQIRGRVVEIREEGADAHIDQLSRKYTGSNYANRTDNRVIYRIEPDSIQTMG